MLTASSEPCIGTDGQVASISRENHAFCAGRADLLPDWSVKERLKRQHAKIRLRNAVPYGNLALNRPSLGGHLGNVGLDLFAVLGLHGNIPTMSDFLGVYLRAMDRHQYVVGGKILCGLSLLLQ